MSPPGSRTVLLVTTSEAFIQAIDCELTLQAVNPNRGPLKPYSAGEGLRHLAEGCALKVDAHVENRNRGNPYGCQPLHPRDNPVPDWVVDEVWQYS